jgi:amino acid adenylation domain-containing protein
MREVCPQAIALRHGDRQLTYEQLNSQADRFTAYLAQLGAGPGTTVALCMDRSFDWIVAALGIMRAGATYVPLDAAWPDARLRYAVEDSGAVALVACATLQERLQLHVRGVDMCRDAAEIAASPAFAATPIAPESLAYVIYTSGSTGVPKGVEITHANLLHLIRWHIAAFGVTPSDRASHLAGLGFDAAVWEIWPHLAAGATVCLADDAVRLSPELLQQWMLQQRVTISFVPTVHAAPLMALAWPPETPLRFLLTGGDALQRGPAVGLPFAVVNNYGPTEGTVVATSGILAPSAEFGSAVMPPIGRAISGTTVYLLSEHGEPVADGAAGEIYIGGNGIARGYRNLPEQTERFFLPDPFAGSPDARMYRTGDRAVRRPDGQLEFRGRLDRQTKIRGFRVELDEIGAVLARHPGVDFAIATSHAQDTDNQLVAYVLPKEGARTTAHELQNHLLRTLPDYMVPVIFVQLSALPLSPNGKLDLRQLPNPESAPRLPAREERPAASPTEEKLLRMVRQLLANEAVAPEDSFFLAGGHSLLGMQLVMRLRETFGVDLTLRQLFEAPTVERLAVLVAALLDERRLATIWEQVLGRDNVGPDDSFVSLGGTPEALAALQQRIAADFGQTIPLEKLAEASSLRQQARLLQIRSAEKFELPSGVLALQPKGKRNAIFWVHYMNTGLAKVIGDDQPLLYVALTAEDFPALGARPTLQAVAACLTRKIISAQPNGPYSIGGYCLGGILGFEIASQLRAAGKDVLLLVLVDPPNPSYIESLDSFKRVASYLGYVAHRAVRLGPRTSLRFLSEHVVKRVNRIVQPASSKTEAMRAQELIETAALAYEPEKYDGKVLLVLASERPPHADFLPGWRAVVSDLHTELLNSHHRDILKAGNAGRVADAIVAHLPAASVGLLPPASAGAPNPTIPAVPPGTPLASTRI